MSYHYALLDPRPTEAAAAANAAIFNLGPVLGVEVTVAALAARCTLGNIDPQHGFHNAVYDNGGYMESDPGNQPIPGEAAIEFAARQPSPAKPGWVGGMVPGQGAILATVRPDLDSVGAIAVLSLLSEGDLPAATMERIRLIAEADKFATGEWAPQPLPTGANPWPTRPGSEGNLALAMVAAMVADHKLLPLGIRVTAMKAWLLTGHEPEQHRYQVKREREELIASLENGAIRIRLPVWCPECGTMGEARTFCQECGQGPLRAEEKVAVVETSHRAATTVGYAHAPVVIALNPAFRLGDSEPHRKFTICAYTAQNADIPAALAELAQLEPGWGGSATIGGSPQGVNSTLTTEQVVSVVCRHLTK